MLLAAYKAGVKAIDWLLLDDFLRMDSQRLQLLGFLSAVFILGTGTAQGRRFSVNVFNALLRELADEVSRVQPYGCSAWLPPFAREVLDLATKARCPAPVHWSPALPERMHRLLAQVSAMVTEDSYPWPKVKRLVADTLMDLPIDADRAIAVDLLGDFRLGPVQFVDDLLVPCQSPGVAAAVCAPMPDSACSRYALRFKAQFGYGPGKTEIMSLFDSPPASVPGCNDTQLRRILGVVVDAELTFKPLLAEVMSRGRTLFSKFFFAAETGGFSVPIMAAQVPLRVESAVLFAGAILATVPGAILALNRLQVEWARRILGCHSGPQVKWWIVIAQCGWARRLGTKLVERAILARARIQLLPGVHPTARMLQIADAVPALSWARKVSALMSSGEFGGVIPDIVDGGVFTQEQLGTARGNADQRSTLLVEYKWQWSGRFCNCLTGKLTWVLLQIRWVS